ncbi:geranylgeranyl diphosphate reductase [Fragilaria crotonensis]|nr:geranylgeranyl diphosphate reductase [Fragilaria crotonensis]
MKFCVAALAITSATAFSPSSFNGRNVAHSAASSSALCMKYKVAVVGGGPSGACAAEIFAQEKNIDTVLFERKLDNAKPCGGAIPLCMVGEFDLPESVVDRKVRQMNLISPTGVEVNIGETLQPDEYIGMCRREILDKYFRDRAVTTGAQIVNGLVTSIDVPADHKVSENQYTINYQEYLEGSSVGVAKSMDVDLIVGADGANSRVAKAMDAGTYNFAIAFQERIKISDEKMKFYEEMAEMYVGDDVSPDFYGWVFPKYDHVGVGTGTVVNRPAIKQYQKAIRDRAGDKIEGGKIIKVEAHPIPEHYRPRRVQGRIALVGDAAGYVTKCSGEGIYFAAKSGRMAAQEIVKLMKEDPVFLPKLRSKTPTSRSTMACMDQLTPCSMLSRRSSTLTTVHERLSLNCATQVRPTSDFRLLPLQESPR